MVNFEEQPRHLWPRCIWGSFRECGRFFDDLPSPSITGRLPSRPNCVLASQLMDYNENFRLFMVARNPNPELPPDASALVCEVNFTVTRSAYA